MTPVRYKWKLTPLLLSSFEPLFCIYVYLLVILPSGSLFGVNFKIICFLLLFFPALLHLLKDRTVTAPHLSFLIALPAVFAAWIVLSLYYGVDLILAFSEYKDLMTTLISSWVAAVYFMNSSRARVKFIRLVLNAELVACFLKVLLLAYSMYSGIPLTVLVDQINIFFNVNLMSLDLGSSLGRIQFVSDGLIPLCIYVVLRYRRRVGISMMGATVIFLLLLFSLVVTFSRYFWGFALIAFCLGLLVNRRDRFHAVVLGVLTLVTVASLPLLISLATLRFSADVAGGSDDTRLEQIIALKQHFQSAPLWGHGLGSHPSDVIRSPDLPYVYEVQLYALAGQVGMVGLGFIGLLTLYYFRSLWPWDIRGRTQRLKHKAGLLLLLLVWLAGGFFNPGLLNSAAALSYAVIKALADMKEDSVATNGALLL